MRNNVFFLVLLIISACNKPKIGLKFVDEYVVKDSLLFEEFLIGGISGIDYFNNDYYMVVDDAENPRILVGNINFKDDKVTSIEFTKLISLQDSINQFYKNNVLDLESVFLEDENTISLVSEGSIRKGKSPSVFAITKEGRFKEEITIPSYFKNIKEGKPKHNGTFESSAKSIDAKGFWVAMEAPLEVDGEEPTFQETQSPIRITYFEKATKKATKQYAYQLEKIDKPSKGKVNLNGVTAILEYDKNTFFVVERIYQSGYGSYGNTVRIFKATVEKESTNTLAITSLKKEKYIPLKKELLLDFSSIKNNLTDTIIDNIEGITLGPKLTNGNQTLLLVSDDNFQKYGKQLNQFIVLEIDEK
ncbi:esterase-like activity of phytase family protein [Tenacibaculum sp. 190524A02b]|uniref:Esterase-like activity of phytase family protein n=1 Tax=Tenacibaculum vairaonense TaxID=3137860 RepID=A0ABM9PNN5_9FLAO